MSDFHNIDVMIGTENTNSIERGLANSIEEFQFLGTLSPTCTQEMISLKPITKIMTRGQMRRETK